MENNEKQPKALDRRFCVAPMMEWTDRHCRFFHRLLTRRALIYTEMLTTGAVLRGDRARLLGFDPSEHPIALQLGGCDPAALAESAHIGEDFGYDEINLNVGCPSDRVQEGRFGACLMAEPALVAECVAAMKASVKIPVTVKCRIGIDEQDPEQALFDFTAAIKAAGTDALIVHARKAWLKGLSPRENREVPPLDYALVRRLKAAHPDLEIVLNGGIASVEQAQAELGSVDGVMMGRAAYQEPWRLFFRSILCSTASRRLSSRPGKPRWPSCRISRASSPKARGLTQSPATCSACSVVFPARAPSAAISRPKLSSPEQPLLSWLMRSRWCWTRLPICRTSPPDLSASCRGL